MDSTVESTPAVLEQLTDLEKLDVSRAQLWQQNSWRPLFANLRTNEPVSYCPESFFGPYW